MANERIKMITMQIKNGVCLLCIFALMLLFAACFSPHTTQAEVRSFSVILLLVIGLLLMSVLALIAFLRYKMLRNKQQHQEEMNLMMALKMENVRNRFPPHFVFNVLNIFVSNLPKEVDVKPLHLLIQILRSYLLTCDKMAVSLEEELQMVMGYSSLRHETNPFLPMPQFHIAKDVDMSQMLPSMIIQIPVEDVNIWVEDAMLRIEVTDNGCGEAGTIDRKKKNGFASTGTGLRILNSTIEMLNASNERKMFFKMQSNRGLPGEENALKKGMHVSIGVPADYDYNVFK